MSGAFARIGIAVVGFESEEAVSDEQSVRTPVGHRSHDLGRKPNIVHDRLMILGRFTTIATLTYRSS